MKRFFKLPTLAISMFLVVSLANIIGCSDDDDNNNNPNPGSNIDCSTVTATFTAASPIFSSSCAANSSCHGGGSTNGPGPLTTHAQISAASAAIRAAVLSGTMPKTGSITIAQRNTIICWIDAGAKND